MHCHMPFRAVLALLQPLLTLRQTLFAMAASLSRQLPPPETPRLDTEGELAAALHELEGLGRLGRSASVMGLLPTPRDYAAREAARHCRSLADHLLDADPMARPATAAPPPVATPPRASSHTPTRHAAAPQVWRPSLAEQRRSDPAGVGWTWERKAGLGAMWRLDDELLRAVPCCTAEPSPNPTPARLAPPCLSTESSSTQVLCWTDFRTRSAAHCASKVLGLGLGLGSGQLGFATVPMPPSPAIHGPGGAWGLESASTSPLGCRGEATHGPGGADDALRSAS